MDPAQRLLLEVAYEAFENGRVMESSGLRSHFEVHEAKHVE